MRWQIVSFILLVLSVCSLSSLLSGCGGDEEGQKQTFRAGVASTLITPKDVGQFMAGYGHPRVSESTHDDLYCRALALDDGTTRLVLVTCDLIGLLRADVQDIRAQVKDMLPGNIIICATHTHSGPDTMGLWGPAEDKTGVDPKYMEFLKAQVVACISEAISNLRTARLCLADTEAPEGIAHNARDAKLIDNQISIMQVTDAADQPLATLVNWGCHPEVLTTESKAISSDWVHYMRQEIESAQGGKELFFNGALGGMVTPTVKEHSFAEAERVGRAVGKQVLAALKKPEKVPAPALEVRSGAVKLNLTNELFKLAAKHGVTPAAKSMLDDAQTEVGLITIGTARAITLPGEPLPAVGLAAKKLLTTRYKFLFSLANDELGYILPSEYADNKDYKYEWTMSIGADTAPSLLAKLKELIAGPPPLAPKPHSTPADASAAKTDDGTPTVKADNPTATATVKPGTPAAVPEPMRLEPGS